ncbi:MAG TPA: YjbQ family protein [Thermoplasmatales archaeon]|nr:MAG: YjbQ family protein [Thermoplasmata archaeon]RLF33959.1 MAG: YjbQ family protein [Thermoplasmata archaeon]HDN51512.1 YjbQ family protein [Thermoplasmatales archaeon]
MKEFTVRSEQRNQMIDITREVQRVVEHEGVKDGMAVIYVPHTTAAVVINEGADPDVQRDIMATLQKLIPGQSDYRHLEGNSDAHIKSALIGCSQTLLVKEGRLLLGTWQHIFFFEGDGPRTRRVFVNVFGKSE